MRTVFTINESKRDGSKGLGSVVAETRRSFNFSSTNSYKFPKYLAAERGWMPEAVLEGNEPRWRVSCELGG